MSHFIILLKLNQLDKQQLVKKKIKIKFLFKI